MGSSVNKVKRVGRATERVFAYIAFGFMFGVVLLTTTDVASRFALNKPFTGTVDITTIMMVTLCWLGMAWATATKRHITVDLLVPKLPARAQAIIEGFNLVGSLVLLCLITWVAAVYAWETWQVKTTFEILPISEAPFRFLVCIGAFMASIELVFSLVEHLTTKRVKGSGSSSLEETELTERGSP